MKLLLILPEPASEFGRKSFAIDAESLADAHEASAWFFREGSPVPLNTSADFRESLATATFVQIYGTTPAPLRSRTKGRLILADPSVKQTGRSWFSPPPPLYRVSVERDGVPEAVAKEFFLPEKPDRIEREVREAGVFRGRRDLQEILELTSARLFGVREDLQWRVFDEPPTAGELRGCDLWVDPATAPEDLDGFVAEAIVCGVPVVATRIPVNEERLERGASGLLVPPLDPNELAHGILSSLFKPEVSIPRRDQAWSGRERFAASVRAAKWTSLYRALIP